MTDDERAVIGQALDLLALSREGAAAGVLRALLEAKPPTKRKAKP